MFKKLNVALLVCLLLGIFSGSVIALEAPTTNIFVIENDGYPITFRTTATNISEFLQLEGLELSEKDMIDTDPNRSLEEDMTIIIRRAVPIRLFVNGELSELETAHRTVSDFVSEYEKDKGHIFIYDLDSDTPIIANLVLSLQTKEKSIIVENFDIPFDTEIIETDELLQGEEIIEQHGNTGTQTVTFEVTYIAGEESERITISDEITLEPVQEIIKRGTAKTVQTSDGDRRYVRHLEMNATAYSLAFCCTGKNPGDFGYGITASGMKAREGVVAVDPNIIPLGTELYISGYGFAIAGDTGSAIKGNKIDLFFSDHSNVIAFGRQTKNVYILE